MSNPMKATEIGENKTGIATSPLGFEPFESLEGIDELPNTGRLEQMRLEYSQEAEPVGTMPSPLNFTDAVKNVGAMLTGKTMSVLLDKIGERFAYERAGARLYDALLIKLDASHAHDESITLKELEHIRDDELRHAGVLATAMQQLGGDPTAVTPCADIVGVAGGGFVAVLTDAKSTLTQCLNMMLTVELGDFAGWTLLIELAEHLGQTEIAEEFRECAEEEAEHERKIREWVRVSVIGQADREEDPAQETRH
jgi:bacterioferritin (cytochrome b1)